MPNLAGDTARERRVWNSYLFAARSGADAGTAADPLLDIARAASRLPAGKEQALQEIVFSSFALEYRMRRIFKVLGLSHRERDTLGSLVANFLARVQGAPRLDDGRPIK